jgi:uncharacterized membrane protein YvlD (DUF360 family)
MSGAEASASVTPPEAPTGTGRLRRGLHRIARVWADEYDTVVNWPSGRRHLITRLVIVTVVDTIALQVAAALLPGVTIDSWWAALVVTVVAGLLTFLLRPAAFLVLPQGIVTTVVLTVVLMGFTLSLAARLVRDVVIDNILWAFLAALMIAAINAILTGIMGLDEDESFYRNSLRKLARVRGDVDDRPGPGFVILQVDGLAEPVIKNALRTGVMPFLASWVRDGSHRLGSWEALAPSMTSAGQTGILHGNNAGIPAFRWWERDRGYLMVSNHPEDAWLIEQRASGPGDLLRDGGASISNLVSGGAPRSIATNSQLAKAGQGIRMDSFSLYLVNPYNITRGAVMFLWTLVLEYFQARRQRVRDVRPRISRAMPFPFLRASTAVLLKDMLTDLCIGEMYRGTPVMYADYLGYDEVAHHAGPERPEALDELDKFDRILRTLWRASEGAPRPYHFILLSDHGQSQGATFEERYGQDLEELVRGLMIGETRSIDATEDVEGWGPVNAFFTEVVRSSDRTAQVARRALGRSTSPSGLVTMGPDRQRGVVSQPFARDQPIEPATEEVPDLVVAASGNLANLYFPRDGQRRLSLEDILARHPGLVEGLVAHPGIGFALVRSESHGAIAIGGQGIHYLDERRVEGRDPLAAFGEHTADNLRRLDSFDHVGDILVNSMYDPSTDEIAPFEHQVGAHGGLGGPQTKAFVLYPSILDEGDEPVSLVGAEAVNASIHAWMRRAREIHGKEGAAAEAAPGGVAPAVASMLAGSAALGRDRATADDTGSARADGAEPAATDSAGPAPADAPSAEASAS